MSTSLICAVDTQSASAPVRRGSLPSLTGLRWCSALLVFGLHVHNFGYVDGPNGALVWRIFNILVAGGSCGVSVFFVLSGFVLVWASRPAERARDLWWRRAARVYPLHLATALIAGVLASTFVTSLNSRDGLGNVANLLLVSSWNHNWWQVLDPASWSLVCEAFFYALFPLIMLVLTRCSVRALYVIAGTAVTITLALAVVGAFPWFPIDVYSFPAARLPEFVVGMTAALLVRRDALRGPRLSAAIGIWVGAYAIACFLSYKLLPSAITLVPSVLLIAALARQDLTGRVGLLGSRLFVRLGEISYAFYLTQLLVIHTVNAVASHLMFNVTLRGPVVLVGVFALTLGLSWALNVIVERPSRVWLLSLQTMVKRRPANEQLVGAMWLR